MANSLLKTIAHNSFADGIYKGILTRAVRYYYFLGKTLPWDNETIPPIVIDSKAYERDVRNETIAMKEITPSDIAYILPRVDWTTGLVYDAYDDQYSTEIQGIDLTAGGSGYSVAPTITIGTEITTNKVVILNEQYFYGNFIYTVTTAGNTQTTVLATTLLGVIGTQYTLGTSKLTCVGVKATATCAVISGLVKSITMSIRGSGYTLLPAITITPISGGANASALAVMTKGILGTTKLEDTRYYVFSNSNVYICVWNNNGGTSTVAPTGISSGYLTTADSYIWKYITTVPSDSKFLTANYMPIYTVSQNQYTVNGSVSNVVIENAGSGYVIASTVLPLLTAVLVGEKYFYNGYVYRVTIAGTTTGLYGSPTTTTGITYVNGATFVCDGILTTIVVSGDGTGASLTPMLTDGLLTGVQVNNAGSGYSYINTTVLGEGYSAALSASFSSSTSQYVKQEQAESATIAGNICSIKVISGGYGYSATPTVSIVGDGTDATATATVDGGKITKINIVGRGTNFNWATITISDSIGTGASARAIVSPYGGLGKDPINQLCCKSLMFYSKFSDNTNQGLVVSNDYRQTGIIKDPLRYKDGTYLTSNFATTCWKVSSGSLIPVGIVQDAILNVSSNSINYRFRVIFVSGKDCLMIPLDNGVPVSGMQFLNASGSFISTSVVPPTVDKYSGDMLFIDNEPSFVAMTGAASVLRTVINF